MTELIWDGKYGPDGKRTRPVRLALPFQDIETVNESSQVRTRMLDLFAKNQPGDWRNRLIWGDKKYVLPSLLPEFAGKVNLIYIDPPFATGADFSFTAQIPDDPLTDGDQSASFVKQPSMIEQKAYRDTWGRGLDGYLQWMYDTLELLCELLSDDGSIYVHCDYRTNAYIRIILVELLGEENFKAEIIWKRTFNAGSSKGLANKLPANTDTIFYFTRTGRAVFNKQWRELNEAAVRRYDKLDENGRRFKWNPMKTYSEDRLKAMIDSGEAMWTPTSKYPVYKKYFDETDGSPVDNLWTDIGQMGTFAQERTQYPTQKPEALLERIIQTSSNEGDLVLDCFAGSGTTAAVAEKLNRRWITADLGRFAVNTTRKRLLAIPEVRPFVVQNLGKYERQAWQVAEFGQDTERAAEAQARYRGFILDLYRAQPIEGYSWLHGLKAGHFVHVGSVDAPVVVDDVRAIAREFWRAVGKGAGASTNSVDVLGWDFAFELNELGRQMAADANINLAFRRIPREVLEKKAVEQGDIRFFELAALDVSVDWQPPRTLCVALRDFLVPPDDVPEEVQRAVTHWSQLIDYWAVDWDNHGDTFHNQWQTYRSKKQPKLALSASHAYDAPGRYTVLVKVIDILGNDTTKSVSVEVQ